MVSGKAHSALPIKGEQASAALHSSLLTLHELSPSSPRDLWTFCLKRKMALSQKTLVLALAVVFAVCIQLYQAHDFPGRCTCLSSIKFIRGNMSDFQVLERRPGCDKTELIVTMNMPNNSTEKICINTEGKMARAFLRCWERINKDESRKMECIDKKRKAE